MPTNKNAQLRYRILDRLRERVSYDAPIKAYPLAGRKCYYRYEDPGYRLFNKDLSMEEVQTLRSTIEMLGRYRGIPANHGLRRASPTWSSALA